MCALVVGRMLPRGLIFFVRSRDNGSDQRNFCAMRLQLEICEGGCEGIALPKLCVGLAEFERAVFCFWFPFVGGLSGRERWRRQDQRNGRVNWRKECTATGPMVDGRRWPSAPGIELDCARKRFSLAGGSVFKSKELRFQLCFCVCGEMGPCSCLCDEYKGVFLRGMRRNRIRFPAILIGHEIFRV